MVRENYVLILDDDRKISDAIQTYLESDKSDVKIKVFKAETPAIAFQIMNENNIDVIFLDIYLKEDNGFDILKKIKSDYENIEIIMISGIKSVGNIVESIKFGAIDYIEKPFDYTKIISSFEKAILNKKKFDRINMKSKVFLDEMKNTSETEIIFGSKKMESIIHDIQKVAQQNTIVLIRGESGTGKELIARVIHYSSFRKNGIFHSLNISSLSDSLFESELFGYTKGAFTDAKKHKQGWFKKAHGGTLFLDEIGDLSLESQKKLLRVISENTIIPVGSTEPIKIDVRLITATNRDLEKLMKLEKFRLDLYHRLKVFEITLPPLRDRKEDIPILIKHFTKTISKKMNKKNIQIDADIYTKLKEYPFPGNVRELKNMVEKAIILCENNRLKCKDFPISKIEIASCEECINLNLKDNEKELIEKALKSTNHVGVKAAKLLGILPDALYRRIDKLMPKKKKKRIKRK